MLSWLADGNTSLKRLNKFLRLPELADTTTPDQDGRIADSAICIEDGRFEWEQFEEEDEDDKNEGEEDNDDSRPLLDRPIQADINSSEAQELLSAEAEAEDQKAAASFQLQGINVELMHGELVAIVGPVGSGKTSMLNCMLGEMKRTAGRMTRGAELDISYASQRYRYPLPPLLFL
jgi:ATPase subunit of ABC transporter with duplicated ATPase domains